MEEDRVPDIPKISVINPPTLNAVKSKKIVAYEEALKMIGELNVKLKKIC